MENEETFFARTRRRVDERFARWARWVAAHPWHTIVFFVVALALLVPQARFVEVSTNTEEFVLPDHPIRIAYGQFKQQFGSDNYVLITIEHDDLFSEDFLAWLAEVHDALEERVPYIEEITSLVNVRSTRGEGDELLVDDLMEEWPETDADFARLRALVASTPFYQRLVLGDDGRRTTIQMEVEAYQTLGSTEGELEGFGDAPVETDGESGGESAGQETSAPISGAQEAEIMAAVHAVLDEHARPDVVMTIAGTPVTNVRIFEDMGRNLVIFVLLSTLVVSLVLAFIFRRAAGVFLPLLVVFASLAAMFGFIGLRGSPVNMTVQILPSFLLAVGTSSSIHLLVIFFQHFDRGASRPDALAAALGHAGAPVSLACMTTAAGLASFLVADIAPVKDMGFMAPIGILMGLILCLALLPALLAILPMRKQSPITSEGPSRLGLLVARIGDFAVLNPLSVLGCTAVLVALATLGLMRVRFEHNALNWFPDDDPIHENTRVADRYMAGSASIEVLVDTGRENGLHEPAMQRALDAFEREVDETGPDRASIRKTISVNGVLKEIHQALNENDPSYYTTPDDRTLIAQELLLFENSGSDDLENLVDSQFQVARVSLRSVWGSGSFYQELLGRIDATARAAFPDARVQLTGLVPIIMTSLTETEEGMKKSYALALVTITPLMILLIGSLRGGLSSMVPNLAPILMVVGVMGWLDIPFDVFTVMTGSVAIGLAVDDTIHFLHGFYREFESTGDTRASVRRTLETTGEALLTTSVVLAIGFSVFLFATMPSLQVFGLITTLAIILAFVADILVGPALVTLATRHRQRAG